MLHEYNYEKSKHDYNISEGGKKGSKKLLVDKISVICHRHGKGIVHIFQDTFYVMQCR